MYAFESGLAVRFASVECLVRFWWQTMLVFLSCILSFFDPSWFTDGSGEKFFAVISSSRRKFMQGIDVQMHFLLRKVKGPYLTKEFSMDSWPETRLSLIARLANPKDASAWRQFESCYQTAIYRFARSRSLQVDEAMDVVQQG